MTSLIIGALAVYISAGWISGAADIDNTGLRIDYNPERVAGCERVLAKLAEPQHNTWKNRLAAWKCRKP